MIITTTIDANLLTAEAYVLPIQKFQRLAEKRSKDVMQTELHWRHLAMVRE